MTAADVAQINQRLDELTRTFSTEFGKLAAAVSAIQATCTPCKAIIEKHDEAIYGNGRDGLRGQVVGLSTVQGSHAAAIGSLRSTRKRAAWELIRFGGGVLLGVVVAVVTTYVGGQ